MHWIGLKTDGSALADSKQVNPTGAEGKGNGF